MTELTNGIYVDGLIYVCVHEGKYKFTDLRANKFETYSRNEAKQILDFNKVVPAELL